MFERFTDSARSVVINGRAEACRRGARRIGTDHLLLGLLNDPATAAVLDTSLEAARNASAQLDAQALAAIGIPVGALPLPTRSPSRGRTPFTVGARQAMKRTAVLGAEDPGHRITERHLLRAVVDAGEPDAALALLSALGVTRGDVLRRLAEA
jgi:ATP-dependent Clp protease ATP-binding subunit ClpA